MTKNVVVVDEFGVDYGTTYLKRAKGLVKHGRARFIDDNRICLTRPPDNPKFLEDDTMENTENTENIIAETGEIAAETVESGENPVTLREIIDRIDRIAHNTSYMQNIGKNDSAVLARETTNQKAIAFLERIYYDLKSAQEPKREYSYELAKQSYDTFVNSMAALPPADGRGLDNRPREARIMFERLFRLGGSGEE
ncbi:MAG: hypothetical protein LBS90_04610 [Oscillospiraceae bacterium]|jgi:hypothetical protein|nr:hypothetical protein [Oscillospiraceae bacterium]